jgi:uncharacterized protein (TIGR03083 family)
MAPLARVNHPAGWPSTARVRGGRLAFRRVSEIGQVYAEGRARITELVAGLDDEAAATRVSACAAWTVADVVAHLTGVCADILAGNIAGVASDPWTAAQVEARRGRSPAELVAEWSEVAPQVEAFAQHFPGRVGAQWVLDLTTHEHDIRAALGHPGARDSEGVAIGVEFMVHGLAASVTARGLAPLEVRVPGQSWVVGTGQPLEGTVDDALGAAVLGTVDFMAGDGTEPAGSVDAPSAWELMRALTGRRSVAQVTAYRWSVADPEGYVAAFRFGPFTPASVDLQE